MGMGPGPISPYGGFTLGRLGNALANETLRG